MSERISLEEAERLAVDATGPLDAERISADDALGRVLAEDVRYATPLPRFDHSAMDGYAIAGAAAAGATFAVHGESRAGVPARSRAQQGEAVAISTGAALPDGTDSVVPWEQVAREGDTVRVVVAARLGQNVRRAGDDAAAGAIAVAAGTRLGPRQLGALAVADRAVVHVTRRPRVLLAVTGDELREPGATDASGIVVDSNGPLLAALIARAGASVVRVRVPDSAGALRDLLGEAMGVASGSAERDEARAARWDLVVTVGGAADGEHDHVARVLRDLAAETLFRGVAIKPGKPAGLARLRGGVPTLFLPGNPGSAYVTFALLGLPILRVLSGETQPLRHLRARLAAPVHAPADRCAIQYGALAVREGALTFSPARNAASGSMPAVAAASALALVPAGASLGSGDLVDAIDLEIA